MEFYKTRALGKKKRRARKVDKDLAGAPWGDALCSVSASDRLGADRRGHAASAVLVAVLHHRRAVDARAGGAGAADLAADLAMAGADRLGLGLRGFAGTQGQRHAAFAVHIAIFHHRRANRAGAGAAGFAADLALAGAGGLGLRVAFTDRRAHGAFAVLVAEFHDRRAGHAGGAGGSAGIAADLALAGVGGLRLGLTLADRCAHGTFAVLVAELHDRGARHAGRAGSGAGIAADFALAGVGRLVTYSLGTYPAPALGTCTGVAVDLAGVARLAAKSVRQVSGADLCGFLRGFLKAGIIRGRGFFFDAA